MVHVAWSSVLVTSSRFSKAAKKKALQASSTSELQPKHCRYRRHSRNAQKKNILLTWALHRNFGQDKARMEEEEELQAAREAGLQTHAWGPANASCCWMLLDAVGRIVTIFLVSDQLHWIEGRREKREER